MSYGLLRLASRRSASMSKLGCARITRWAGVFENAFVEQPRSGPSNVTKQQRVLAQVEASIVIFWIASNELVKLSILFFYRRIFIGRAFNICTWILIYLSFVWLIDAVVSWLLYCGTNLKANFEGGWDVCPLWAFKMQMSYFALDSFIDLSLLILPIPFVLKLQTSFSRKVVIVLSFLLRGLAFVAGLNNTIVQLVSLTQPDVVTNASQGSCFQGSTLLISWPTMEIGVGLIACDLPSLSFHAISSLSRQLRRGWSISWEGIHHSLGLHSLHSRLRKGGDPHSHGTAESGTALSRYHSDSESLKYSEQGSSAGILSDFSCQQGLQGQKWQEGKYGDHVKEPALNATGRVIAEFNEV
ncbi:hypothetical protein EV356DRAFT_572347 [Viridothelium virens]|uniref:Rhodopsin domain-containing protein n=1 Tax=Viridothelium virens TaxID=1048519 RepID=A0A6A6HP30_VIRVR|nr:hypothetical protein EV356DRAFT_572347 [Viridothelium virens]